MGIKYNDLNKRVFLLKEEGRSINGKYVFTFDDAKEVWAAIRPANSYVMDNGVSHQVIGLTHRIYIKQNPKCVFTTQRWIVHKPRISAATNYKILKMMGIDGDDGSKLIMFSCVIMDKEMQVKDSSDDLIPKVIDTNIFG